MAMRENTGLQVALIIFVLITVLLAAATYYFFDQAHKTAKEFEKKDATIAAQQSAAEASVKEIEALRQVLGYSRTPENDPAAVSEVQKIFKSDMLGAGYNPDTHTYPMVVGLQADKIKTLSSQVVAAQTRADVAEAKVAEEQNLAKSKIDEYLKQQQDAAAALAKATTEYGTQRGEIKTQADGFQLKFEQASQAVSKVTADKDKEIDALMGRITTLDQRVKNQQEKLKAVQSNGSGGSSSETPDGKITWVSQRGGSVYVNLGSDDGLSRGTMFTVYDSNTVNIGNTEPKASIEITTIRGANLSEGRIIEDTLSNPILSQDVVYSPVWNPGQKTHFALVGFMDVDGDGKSDRRLISGLIAQNGGVIDAEVLDDGTRQGKLSINTHYLVKGEAATDKSSAAVLEASSRMVDEASELGIEAISVERLLSDMGWRGSERTVGTGSDPSGGTFQPKPKSETDLGPKSKFQQRTRPGSTRRGSAY